MPQPGQSLPPEQSAGAQMPSAPAPRRFSDAELKKIELNKECIEVECPAVFVPVTVQPPADTRRDSTSRPTPRARWRTLSRRNLKGDSSPSRGRFDAARGIFGVSLLCFPAVFAVLGLLVARRMRIAQCQVPGPSSVFVVMQNVNSAKPRRRLQRRSPGALQASAASLQRRQNHMPPAKTSQLTRSKLPTHRHSSVQMPRNQEVTTCEPLPLLNRLLEHASQAPDLKGADPAYHLFLFPPQPNTLNCLKHLARFPVHTCTSHPPSPASLHLTSPALQHHLASPLGT
jgi:hypothetical protein